MNNKLNILALALLSLTTSSAFSNDTFNVSICVETPENLNPIDEKIRQELFDHAVLNLHEICDSAAQELEFYVKKSETELEIESEMVVTENPAQQAALHNYLVGKLLAFVDVCNKQAIEENRNVEFHLDTTEDTVALTIICHEVAPEPTYWDSIKANVTRAAQTVSAKATDAGAYIKDATVAGAHKVSNAAYVVKEKTKHGIHNVAEKVAVVTQ